MSGNPVFVVGPSRSGTTLLQEVINLHSQFYISPETHWFDDDRSRRNKPIADEKDRTQAQNWFLSLAHRPFGYDGDPQLGWLERSELESVAEARQTDLARDSYFIAWCELNAARNDKPRWGEKTPRHVFRVNDIMKAFPDAKIVCCIRNAPAMIASYRNWPSRNDIKEESKNTATEIEQQRTRKSYHPAIAALMWRGAIRSSLRALEQHGENRVKLVYYEEMIREPENTLKDLFSWLGEDYEQETINVPMINSSFAEYKGDAGFVTHALERWKQQLSNSDRAVIQLLCGRELRRTGYASVSKWHQLWSALPALLQLPAAVFRAARANQDRTGSLLPYIWRRIRA